MASLADKVLSQEAQDKIANITAQAQSGAISWADANKQANEVRASEGANYSVGAGGVTTYDDGSTISGFSSGSVTSGGKAKDFIDNWNNNATVSTNSNDYYAGGTKPNLSRNMKLAGMTVKQGNYSVTYNEDGYAVSASHDGGKSATDFIKSTHTNDSAWHQAAYQAMLSDNWDLVGTYANKIAETFGRTPEGEINMSAANLYMNELQNAGDYDAVEYYNRLYDQAHGEGSSAAFDATGGAIKTYAELIKAVGSAEKAKQIVTQYSNQNYVSNPDSALLTAMATASANSGIPSASIGGDFDLSDDIKSMFANSLESDLAALGSAFESDKAELKSQSDIILKRANEARRQAAAQAALEKQKLGEMATSQGLNSGTTGQMALAQNVALQGNLASLAEQEAASLADNDLALAKLLSAYRADVNELTADSNARLTEALIEEAIRRQNRTDELMEQARDYAISLLASGVMPDPETLEAAGISVGEAQMLYAVATGADPATGTPSDGGSTPPDDGIGSGYNNGRLSVEEVKKMQRHINEYRVLNGQPEIAVDGRWGAETTAATEGMSADEYARHYYAINAWSGRSDR